MHSNIPDLFSEALNVDSLLLILLIRKIFLKNFSYKNIFLVYGIIHSIWDNSQAKWARTYLGFNTSKKSTNIAWNFKIYWFWSLLHDRSRCFATEMLKKNIFQRRHTKPLLLIPLLYYICLLPIRSYLSKLIILKDEKDHLG